MIVRPGWTWPSTSRRCCFRSYRGKRRPISHYSLGWLPRWISVLDRLPRVGPAVVNRALRFTPLARLLLSAGGIDPRRTAPEFAPMTFHRWFRKNGNAIAGQQERESVVLWTDSFSNGMNPEVARAAVSVLQNAGYRVIVPDRVACCGLTWITTGQLDGAKKRLGRLLDILEPSAGQGIPIVGLEPSCVAVLRSDLLDLLPDDPRSATVAAATRTLAELLTGRTVAENAWQAPDLTGRRTHCATALPSPFGDGFRHRSTICSPAWGPPLTVVAGCCGLAGNFGMEKGHYEMSMAVAGNALLPALADRTDSSIVLADGFSCRTQIEQLAGLPSLTLAQLLADHLAASQGHRPLRTGSTGCPARAPRCSRPGR